MGKEDSGREKILAAIRRAAAELGRAPSRGELRRITGVSHYRVLAEFPTLREAVRAAGLEPNPKGEKISTEDLLSDWKRVAEKLGRRPSRAEYVREGRYSAGALTVRFGSWGKISTTEGTEEHREKKSAHRGGAETRRKKELPKPEERNHKGAEEARREKGGVVKHGRAVKPGESVLHNFDRVPLAPVPSPVVGMRRVTEAVAQMVVNTLLGDSIQLSALSILPKQNQEFNHKGHEGTQRKSGTELALRGVNEVGDDGLMRGDFTPRGVMKDRPVMGEPFDRRPMTNAPVNELGVMVLFGMVAAGLGLQVESVQGKFPDCIARRQVAPGKWQYLRIEFEYESKNFKLHGHDPKGCDMIVCWRHNWKECPAEIEVVELSRLVRSN
ncbi:MAG: homing endonuclease associated repeat-containing protein [Terriglobales bacterium]